MAKRRRSLLKRRKLVPGVVYPLHANSTCETLVRLQQMGVARWMLSSALTLVIASVWYANFAHIVAGSKGRPSTSRQCMAIAAAPLAGAPVVYIATTVFMVVRPYLKFAHNAGHSSAYFR